MSLKRKVSVPCAIEHWSAVEVGQRRRLALGRERWQVRVVAIR